MDPRNLLQLADVALSRGALANQPPSPFTSPTPSFATERFPASQTLRHFPSMPHINTFIQQNTQSPPPLNRVPAPTPQIRPPQRRPIHNSTQSLNNSLMVLSNNLRLSSAVSVSASLNFPLKQLLNRRINRCRRRHHQHLHPRSVSRVVIRTPFGKLLTTQASSVFGLRFLRLASALERTRIRRRSQLQPRRLHSRLTNQNGITTTTTFYSSLRIARATPSRQASASARSSKRQRTFSKCAVAPATDRHVSSFPGSALMRPRKFGVLISSPTTSTTTPSAKVCLHYSVVWIVKTLIGSNCACSPNPAPNPSPHSRRAPQTCRPAPTPTSLPNYNST